MKMKTYKCENYPRCKNKITADVEGSHPPPLGCPPCRKKSQNAFGSGFYGGNRK